MKPVLDALKNYLDSKGIKYDVSTANTVWFSLLIPTPEIKEMPNRFVSCGIRIPERNGQLMFFSATVMVVEMSEEMLVGISSVLMKFQSSEFRAGRIVLHPDGTIFYTLTQFLCTGGTIDEQAIAAMITTAVLEIASIFMIRDNAVKILPLATVSHFGMA
ncbi:MAG TPA: hypothetical protein VJ161_06080 [Geobacteraceae bacterium]|jgi:hypothetical protein|nr:hypothetical protein [Geobacteraceae bacterium]